MSTRVADAVPNGNQGIDSYQLADENVRCLEVEFTAAQVKASNSTMLPLVPAPGANRVLFFHNALVQIFGGTANYDNNQNFTINYQSGGGGATVSTTLANFLNGGVAAKLGTIKQITTDITPEANQPLVLKSSASPYSAAGNRRLKVKIFYSVMDVRTGL